MILAGIMLLTTSVDTIYLTSTSSKGHEVQLRILLNNLQLCAYRHSHVSVIGKWSATYTCTVAQLSHCLWKKVPRARFSLPSTTTYCGIIASLPDRWTRSTKRMLSIKVARNLRINFHFLNFNFQWVDLECAAHGIAVVELFDRSRNIFCGNRLPWTVVTIGHQAIVEIATLPNIKFEFSISYFHSKLQWFSAIYLEYNDFNEISETHGGFINLIDLITGYDYYILVDPWQRMRITLSYDMPSNASISYYDGPGDKSEMIYNTNHGTAIGIPPVLTTSYRSMIRINMPVKVTMKIDLFNNVHIMCDVNYSNYNVLVNSTANQSIACVHYLNVTYDKKDVYIENVYPLLHINYFSFHGPSVITGESDHNCQYGGIFIWKNIDKESTYICHNLHTYNIYSDVASLVIFLIWYPEYSSYVLNAQFRKTKCFTRYAIPQRMFLSSMENTLNISDSLPCELIICTPSQFKLKQNYCTVSISSQGSIGTASIYVKQSDFLHNCFYVDVDTQNFTIYANVTENWPFGKPRDIVLIRSSLEDFYSLYPYLNIMKIRLPYICPKQGSLKQMSVKVKIPTCKTTPKGLLHNVLLDILSLTPECSNLDTPVKFLFKADPYFDTTSRQMTVIQKDRGKAYVGVYVSVSYKDCPKECRHFTYTLSVLDKRRERIYQYTKPVGTDTFTGYFHQGLNLTITLPYDMCGRHFYCKISYSSVKSTQNSEITSNTSVTELGERAWHFQPKRYATALNCSLK